MDATDKKLMLLQSELFKQFGFKIDIYRQEGKGVLVVPHGASLHFTNVIFKMDDEDFGRW